MKEETVEFLSGPLLFSMTFTILMTLMAAILQATRQTRIEIWGMATQKSLVNYGNLVSNVKWLLLVLDIKPH